MLEIDSINFLQYISSLQTIILYMCSHKQCDTELEFEINVYVFYEYTH